MLDTGTQVPSPWSSPSLNTKTTIRSQFPLHDVLCSRIWHCSRWSMLKHLFSDSYAGRGGLREPFALKHRSVRIWNKSLKSHKLHVWNGNFNSCFHSGSINFESNLQVKKKYTVTSQSNCTHAYNWHVYSHPIKNQITSKPKTLNFITQAPLHSTNKNVKLGYYATSETEISLATCTQGFSSFFFDTVAGQHVIFSH